MGYIKNISNSLITKIIKIIIGFGTSIIVARALGAEGKGYITYILLIGSLLANYGHLGILDATIYFQKRSNYSQQEVFNVNISFIILIWFFISIFIISMRLFRFILLDYSIFMVIGLIFYVIINFFNILGRKFHVGEEKIVDMNKFLLIDKFFLFFFLLILWSFKYLSAGYYLLLMISGLFLSSYLLIKNIGFKFRFKLNRSLLKEEFKYGLLVYFATLFIYLNYRADQFLIMNMISTSALGVYSIGVTLAELVLLIPESVSLALNGKLYNVALDSKHRNLITISTIKYTIYICIVIATIGFFLTPLIPVVYGEEFIDAVSVFKILLFGVLFVAIGKTSNAYFYTQGTPERYLVIVLITFIINLVLNFKLIPILGINGAAWASTISYIIYGLIHIFYFKIKEKFPLKEMFLINKSDIKLFKKYVMK
ncbi:MAG: polysaccharide biosynthesis C-terminal domain-containing protein [bacterium]